MRNFFSVLPTSLPIIIYFRENVVLYNTRETRSPYLMVFVESTSDVQKAVLFAKQHNLKISVKSSGHDYIGRSTADMSLQIITKRMKGRTVNLSSSRHIDGEITAQTGNTWIEVYTEVDALSILDHILRVWYTLG